LAGSFAFTIAVGLIGIRAMISDRIFVIFLFAAVNLSLLAWYSAARQEADSAELKDSIQKIADTAHVDPNQSVQVIADAIISRLEPLTKEVDRLAHPPRQQDGLYQNDKMVGSGVNPLIDRDKGIVNFQVLSETQNLDLKAPFEFQNMTLVIVSSAAISEQRAMGVLTRRDIAQVVCNIVSVAK
jgi:hypothetical protein